MKMDMIVDTRTVRNLYEAGLLMTVAKEISKCACKLHLVGAQEVRWDRGGTEPVGVYLFFLWKGTRIVN
jgi:hypothetical protein